MEIIKLETIEESSIEFKKYLKKLYLILSTEKKTVIFGINLYDKKRIDDVMCCIEASWPTEYKIFVSKRGEKDLKSSICYNQLVKVVRNKFLFSANIYSVDIDSAMQLIKKLQITLDKDMEYINSLWNNL